MQTLLDRVRGWIPVPLVVWVTVALGLPGQVHAQSLRIQSLVRTNGTVSVNHPSDTNRYFLLFRGNRVDQAFLPQDAALGLSGAGLLRDRLPPAGQAFYRVVGIPVSRPLDTDQDGIDDVYELRTLGLSPLNGADARNLDPQGGSLTYLERYQRVSTPAARIARSSPGNGESGVAVTRETVIAFDKPLAPGTMVTSSNLFAAFGGRKLLSRVELAVDRRSVTLFYLENLPAAARVRVTLNGSGIRDENGRDVDADGDGFPGGVGVIDFDTLSVTPVGQTAIRGHVFASELVGPTPGGATNEPLAGVTITVDGAEETLRTVTLADGSFLLKPVPAGRFFVHIDGRTAKDSHWPDGSYYPVVGKAWEAEANKTNLANGTGVIFLPYIVQGTLQPVSPTSDTTITFPAGVVAANPLLAGVEIRVPANALYDDNGTRGGRVGIAPVASDRLPEPLPEGIEHVLDITVQSDGARNFDRPVPVRFPNLPNPRTGLALPPGAKTALVSFNHDLGRWEVAGTMTVSADGKFVDSDPGSGVRQPGWHGWQQLTFPNWWPPPVLWPELRLPPRPGPLPPPFPQPPNPQPPTPPPWPDWPDFPEGPDDNQFPPSYPPWTWDDTPQGNEDSGSNGDSEGDPNSGPGPGGDSGGGPGGETIGDPDGGPRGGNPNGVSSGPFCLKADIEIDCVNTGTPVPAASAVAVNPQGDSAFGLRYSTVQGTVTAEVFNKSTGRVALATQVNPIRPPDSVGFGPASQAFVHVFRQPTGAGLSGDEVVQLYTLRGTAQSTAPSRTITLGGAYFNASSVRFSPHGRYLIYTALLTTGRIGLTVIDVVTRETVITTTYAYSTAPVLVQPADMVQFGPDCADRSLVLRFGDTPTSLAWHLINLESRQTVASRRIAPGSFSSWEFSSCGAAVRLNQGPAAGTVYFATLDGRVIPSLDSAASRAGTTAALRSARLAATLPSIQREKPVAARGVAYYQVVDLLTGRTVQRARTGASGVLMEGLLLAPNRPFRLSVVRATDFLSGRVDFLSGNVGQGFLAPPPILRPDASADTDADGLSDKAEAIIGTNPKKRDTNGDGLSDAAAVRAGLDPLVGSAAATGVVSSLPLPGSVVDVCAVGDRVLVALGQAGIAVVLHTPGVNPTIIAQLKTPGTATRLACSGNLLAVASESAGLAIVDISDPPAARVVHVLPSIGEANCVAVAGGIGFIGTQSGRVVLVELSTGTVLGQTSVGGAVQDLQFNGGRLYVLSNRRLLPFRLQNGELRATGPGVTSKSVLGANRLFVADDLAYITHADGYRVFSLSDGDNPLELTNGSDTQIGWSQLVANGSGIGLAASGPAANQNREVQVYDLLDPTRNNQFLSRYLFPAPVATVAIHRGVAYVGATTAGLQVLNYLDADLGTQAPTIDLSASFLLKPPQIESGQLASITANASDDVQVREVEFYLDGTRLASDGNYPFEHAFFAPTLSAERSSFRFRARAWDTAGNSTWSDELVIALLPDRTPPTARPTAPAANGFAVSPTQVGVLFNEPIAGATLSSELLRLRWLGPDRRADTADDVPVADGTIEYNSGSRVGSLNFVALSTAGRYEAVLLPGVADLSGNLSEQEIRWYFEAVVGIDTDGDGLTDDYERAVGLKPNNADENGNGIPDAIDDFDGDGLVNGIEMLIGTNPRNQRTFNNQLDTERDQDGDSLPDWREIELGTDPRNPDTDGDGWNDEIEVTTGSDPLVPNRALPGVYGGSQVGYVLLWSGVAPGKGEANVLFVGDNTPWLGFNTANALLQGGANVNGQSVQIAQPLAEVRIGGALRAEVNVPMGPPSWLKDPLMTEVPVSPPPKVNFVELDSPNPTLPVQLKIPDPRDKTLEQAQ